MAEKWSVDYGPLIIEEIATWRERGRETTTEREMGPTYFKTVAARQMRIIPPYSIGGVLNGRLLGLAPALLKLAGAG